MMGEHDRNSQVIGKQDKSSQTKENNETKRERERAPHEDKVDLSKRNLQINSISQQKQGHEPTRIQRRNKK